MLSDWVKGDSPSLAIRRHCYVKAKWLVWRWNSWPCGSVLMRSQSAVIPAKSRINCSWPWVVTCWRKQLLAFSIPVFVTVHHQFQRYLHLCPQISHPAMDILGWMPYMTLPEIVKWHLLPGTTGEATSFQWIASVTWQSQVRIVHDLWDKRAYLPCTLGQSQLWPLKKGMVSPDTTCRTYG
jgi:hypothetical protein